MITFESLVERRTSVAVVGLGYVGLPLAVELARHFDVLGFDINAERIDEFRRGLDRTGEVRPQDMEQTGARFSTDPSELGKAGVIIVAVPTPIDAHRNPDMKPLQGASATVGRNMAPGSIVVYESTVYPGLTEEICLPILERESGLTYGRDFTLGYSPERINPGDKTHTLRSIVKVVAGSDEATAELLERLYGSVVEAGIHRASSIRVAEAAKVIENTQRDLNIALMNELALIFNRLGIDTQEVLEAAGSKWNFLPFRPGLVGGHCIGVDPYYLTYKAEEVGYHPQVILAGRRINDTMGKYIAEQTVKHMIRTGIKVHGARVGVLGLTFKENVPDLRNTRVVDIIHELRDYGVEPVVHDPLADGAESMHEYGLRLATFEELAGVDALILAVPHEAYRELGLERLCALHARPEQAILMDVKGVFSPAEARAVGALHWRL